jgi:hypothetical protein
MGGGTAVDESQAVTLPLDLEIRGGYGEVPQDVGGGSGGVPQDAVRSDAGLNRDTLKCRGGPGCPDGLSLVSAGPSGIAN